MTNEGPAWAHPATENPYWEIVKTIPDGGMSSYRGNRFSPTPYGLVWENGAYIHREDLPSRENLVREYSWAIPSPDALEWIVEQLNGRPVVEVGAGTGYWAWQLSQLGADVVAYDSQPPNMVPNGYHTQREKVWMTYTQEDIDAIEERWKPFYESAAAMAQAQKDLADTLLPVPIPMPMPELPTVGSGEWTQSPKKELRDVFYPVLLADVGEAAGAHPDRVLFLCWPPYNTPMAADALRAYEGDTLIYIGEGAGGCTGDDDFHDLLEKEWEESPAICRSHIQWDAIHDLVYVYTRAVAKAIEA